MKTIQLQKGTVDVELAPLCALIARSVANGVPQSDSRYPATVKRIRKELVADVNSGKLPVKNPSTMEPHSLPVGDAFLEAKVLVNDLREYLATRCMEVADMPKVIKQARALPVDPVVLALPRYAQVHSIDNIGTSTGSGICSVGDFIDSENERIKRQGEGYFTVEEAAQVLADSQPGIDVKSMIQRMEKAEVYSMRLVRNSGDLLPVLDSHQFNKYQDVVKVSDVDAWLKSQGVDYRFPPATPAIPRKEKNLSGEGWKLKAQSKAKEIIQEQRALDLYPSQKTLGDLIATDFRAKGIFGPDGKPLTGATIKRHALKSISSAVPKKLSTSIRRGK